VADASRVVTHATWPQLCLTEACTGFTAPKQQAQAGACPGFTASQQQAHAAHLMAFQQAASFQMIFYKVTATA